MNIKKLMALTNFSNEEERKAFVEAAFCKMQDENKTFQEVLEIKDSALEELYALAYTLYNQGKYKEAAQAFFTLVTTSHTNFKYLFGLSSCFHQAKEYENAAMGFVLAYRLQPENPIPLYYAADSLINKGSISEAIECLDIAIDTSSGNAEYNFVKEKCKLIKDSLKVKK